MALTQTGDGSTAEGRRRRHDFGISFNLRRRCVECNKLVLNRGCIECKNRLCRRCFISHVCEDGVPIPSTLQPVSLKFSEPTDSESIDLAVSELIHSPSTPSSKKHLVFVGNPGVGKSVMMRGFFRDRRIAYGPAAGAGHLTLDMTEAEHPNDCNFKGLDIPGIDDYDEEVRQKHDSLLREALQQGGSYQIVFITRLQYGRVVRQEKEMMRRILASLRQEAGLGISENDYGIVVNDIDADTWATINGEAQENMARRKHIEKQILEGLPLKTIYIHFQEHCSGMSFSHNNGKEPQLPPALTTFLRELKIFVKLPEELRIKTIDDIARDSLCEKLRRGHVEEWKKFQESRKQQEEALLNATTFRDPVVTEYTWFVVVPFGVFVSSLFISYCYSSSALLAPVLAIAIPYIVLHLGQRPMYLSKGNLWPLTIWKDSSLLQERIINLALDNWQIYEGICVCKKPDCNIFTGLILVSYVITVTIEMAMCNTGGFERYKSRWFDGFDNVQAVLSLLIACDVASASAWFATTLKLFLQLEPHRLFEFLDNFTNIHTSLGQWFPYSTAMRAAIEKTK